MDYQERGNETNYVAGARFSGDRTQVSMVQKLRPNWQAGRLNLIGGGIEPGETPSAAMKREFWEETDLEVDDWKQFAVLNLAGGNKVHFFKSFGSFYGMYSKTDEQIGIYDVDALDVLNVIPNLKWLIPLALDKDGVTVEALDLS